MTHWTYRRVESNEDLEQGDIIARSDDVLELLTRVHSHFCQDKYLGFLVTTQSCDMVRHSLNHCKTQYVNLSAIRSLESVVPQILAEACGTGIDRIFTADKKDKAQEAIQRILNQNEQSHGLFYLHPDSDAGIAVPAVAMLRITIAIRSEHYELLCKSRCGRLEPIFSSKLGWLTGNLYSRVATPDWSDADGGKAGAEKISKQLLNSKDVKWVAQSTIKAAKKQNIDFSGLSTDEALTVLKQHAPKPPKEVAIESVASIAKSVFDAAAQQLIHQVSRDIRNFRPVKDESETVASDQVHSGATDAIAAESVVDLQIIEAVKEAIGKLHDDALNKLKMRLKNDQEFTKCCRDA